MFSQELDGLAVPIDDLNVPKGVFFSWRHPYRDAFTLSLRTLGSNFVELRYQQLMHPGRVPDESGSMMMLQTLKNFTELVQEGRPRRPLDLTTFTPLLPVADRVVSILDQYLDRQALANRTMDWVTPVIHYAPDSHLEIMWRNY